jgi:putative nucleotidyltransferase with HDIG domain
MTQTIARPSVEELAAAVGRLPTLPATVRAVMDACDGLETDARDVARLVLADQGLTANLLKLANSAAYGHRRRVTTVSDAVVIMGLSAVKSLAISSHTAQLLSRALRGYEMERGDLWRHSLSVAFIARRLAGAGEAAAEEAFVAGLLHDVGKVVLSDSLGDAFDELTHAAQSARCPLSDSERDMLGFDHADLGARIAATWGFPERLVEVIGLHHRPEEAGTAADLAACVALADTVAHALAGGIDIDDIHHLVDPAHLDAVALDEPGLTRLVAEMAPLLTTDPLAE